MLVLTLEDWGNDVRGGVCCELLDGEGADALAGTDSPRDTVDARMSEFD